MVKHTAMGRKKFLLDKFKKKYMHRKGKKHFNDFWLFVDQTIIVLGRHGIDSLPVKTDRKKQE